MQTIQWLFPPVLEVAISQIFHSMLPASIDDWYHNLLIAVIDPKSIWIMCKNLSVIFSREFILTE